MRVVIVFKTTKIEIQAVSHFLTRNCVMVSKYSRNYIHFHGAVM
jgi:hypothetical protein